MIQKWKSMVMSLIAGAALFISGGTIIAAEEYVSFNSHYYKVFEDGMSWQQAAASCEAMGGNLVSIGDRNEQNFVENLISGHSKNAYWIGLQDKNGKWKWVDSTGYAYDNWGENQPDNYYGDEKYGMMYGISASYDGWSCVKGTWNDCRDTSDEEGDFSISNFGYICEWKKRPNASNETAADSMPDSADISNEITADPSVTGSFTSNEEVQAVRNEVWAAYGNELEARRNELTSGSITLDGQTMKVAVFIIGEPGAEGYPVYFALHGGGNPSPEIADDQFEVMQNYYRSTIESGIYVVPRCLSPGYDEHYLPDSFRFYDRIIEDAILFYNADPNRIYLTGFSSGGDGVYAIAPKYADRLAAANMSAGFPHTHKLENLYNMPICLQMGELDSAFDRNSRIKDYDEWLHQYQQAYGGGFIHDTFIHQNGTHNQNWTDIDNSPQSILREDSFKKQETSSSDYVLACTGAIAWMNQYVRDPFPKRVVWATSEFGAKRKSRAFYWLDRDGYLDNETIIASYDPSNNHINIEKCDADQGTLKVYLNRSMVNLFSDVTVTVKGHDYVVRPIVSRQIMETTLRDRGDYKYMFDAEIDIHMNSDESLITVEAVGYHEKDYERTGVDGVFKINDAGLLLPSADLFGLTYEQLCAQLERNLSAPVKSIKDGKTVTITVLNEKDGPFVTFYFVDGKVREFGYESSAGFNQVASSAGEVFGARIIINGVPTTDVERGILTLGGMARYYLDSYKKGFKKVTVQTFVMVGR